MAPTSAGRSRPVLNWDWRHWRHGPPRCPGTVFGYQSLVAGLLARIRRELADQAGVAPGDVKTILTGGLSAAPWATDLDGIDAIDPDLTLKGLAIMHAEVAGGERLELGLP